MWKAAKKTQKRSKTQKYNKTSPNQNSQLQKSRQLDRNDKREYNLIMSAIIEMIGTIIEIKQRDNNI